LSAHGPSPTAAPPPPIEHTRSASADQRRVKSYFQSQADYWERIYAGRDLRAEIYRARQAVTLDWVNRLSLPTGARVLEVGSGAGFLAVALAERGLVVDAIDPSDAMVARAHRRATNSAAAARVTVAIGAVEALAFADGYFDLVVALGVIPWVPIPQLAILEMARVVRPGGHLILTADNRWRLSHLLDPRLNPALGPVRSQVSTLLDSARLRPAAREAIPGTYHSRRFIDDALTNAALMKVRGITLGFGPFTFLGRNLLSERSALGLHRRLQRFADSGLPILRSTGAHYLVLARKPSRVPSRPSTTAADSGPMSRPDHQGDGGTTDE
jgi:ubiquinone/menaquinone biosynthesis C-methylase UbiE